MKTMLRAADVLADLVTVSREGGAFDDARSNELIAELNAPHAPNRRRRAPSRRPRRRPIRSPRSAGSR